MEKRWQDKTIRLIVGILFAVGWAPVLLAAEEAAQPTASVGPQGSGHRGAEMREDRQQLRQAEGEVHGDMKQIEQDKQLFRQRMSVLESQRAEAMKSGNKEEAEALTGQIRQLRQEGKERRQADFKELRQDKQKVWKERGELRQDRKDYNPPGLAGGPGASPDKRLGQGSEMRQDRRDLRQDNRRVNPPGPRGGPGAGVHRPNPSARPAGGAARSHAGGGGSRGGGGGKRR